MKATTEYLWNVSDLGDESGSQAGNTSCGLGVNQPPNSRISEGRGFAARPSSAIPLTGSRAKMTGPLGNITKGNSARG